MAAAHAAVLFSLNVQGRIPQVNAPVTAPTRITSYNIDASGSVHCPGKALRTFCKPSPPCDLNVGMDTFVDKNENDGSSIQPILRALHLADYKLNENVHFVTFRNNLNKIMETPYNDKNEWRIGLEREAGTIFMNVVKLEDNFSNTPAQKKFQYWGYKFEDVCSEMDCAEQPPHVGAGAADADDDEGKLGKRKREEDAADPKFVEIKTSREMIAPHHRRTFERFKLLKFWIQSFIGGVPSICCGFRDDAGIVNEVAMYKTLEIPRMVRGKPNMWDARRCIDFTAWVLAEVRRATVDGERYELQYAPPFSHVTLVRKGK